MNNVIKFQNTELNLTNRNNQLWLASQELAKGLGYSRVDFVNKIYRAHKDEFSADMVENVESALSGNLKMITRYFSPRGCHLIAMFARTPFAKEFRKWVLDVLENYNRTAQDNLNLVPVNSHVRGKPSGKKEIVLSEKAKSEVGGIVKSCVGEALKAELKGIALTKTFSRDDIHNAMTAEMDRVREIERTKTYRLTELEGSIIDNVRMITGFNYWYASVAFDKMLNSEK